LGIGFMVAIAAAGLGLGLGAWLRDYRTLQPLLLVHLGINKSFVV
jgi:hypothetical protein